MKPSQFFEPVGQSLPATSINGSIRVAEWKKVQRCAHGYVNIKCDRPSDIWIVTLPVKELNAAARKWLHISKASGIRLPLPIMGTKAWVSY